MKPLRPARLRARLRGIRLPWAPGEDPATTGRMALIGVFLALRGLDLAQGLVYALAGAGAYARPDLALLVALAGAGESAWLAAHIWRRRAAGAWSAGVDVAFNTAALLVLAAAIQPGERSGSLDWMLPYSVASAVLYSVAFPAAEGLLASTWLGGVYLATVALGAGTAGGSWLPITVANFLSYLAFYGVALAASRLIAWGGGRLAAARHEAVEQGRELAAARERNRQHRLIHNEALQPLALITTDTGLSPEPVRVAATEALQRLRSLSDGADGGGEGFAGGLEALVREYGRQALRVRVGGARAAAEPDPPVAAAMLEAVREALANVRKHAPGSAAAVEVDARPGAWQVVVSDDGPGFDERAPRRGFGLPSMAERMREIGGAASVRSAPGAGTRVTVRWPAGRPAEVEPTRWLRALTAPEGGRQAAWSAERVLLSVFFLVRAVHLVQAAVFVTASPRAYLHPDAARALFAAAGAESAAVMLLWWRRGRAEPRLAILDALFGIAGLLVLGLALPGGAQQTPTNWMLQYSTGCVLALAVGLDVLPGLLAALLLGIVYWISTTQPALGSPGPSAIALANLLGYAGYFLVARIIVSLVRWQARELDGARRLAVERSAQLAVEAERARYHELIEPLAMRTLARVAADYERDRDRVRAEARLTAHRLRAVIEGRGSGLDGGLSSGLASLAAEFELRGLRLTIVTAELRAEPPEAAATAVLACVHEALADASDHVPGARVTIRALSGGGGGEVTVRDDGPVRGRARPRWGRLSYMDRRMRAVGGSASVVSEPARGAVVSLRW